MQINRLTLRIYPIGGLDWSDMAQEAGSYPCHPAPHTRKPLLLMDLPNTGREGSKFWKLIMESIMTRNTYQSGEKIKVCENCHPPSLCWLAASVPSVGVRQGDRRMG
jgi:hypothetical protein